MRVKFLVGHLDERGGVDGVYVKSVAYPMVVPADAMFEDEGGAGKICHNEEELRRWADRNFGGRHGYEIVTVPIDDGAVMEEEAVTLGTKEQENLTEADVELRSCLDEYIEAHNRALTATRSVNSYVNSVKNVPVAPTEVKSLSEYESYMKKVAVYDDRKSDLRRTENKEENRRLKAMDRLAELLPLKVWYSYRGYRFTRKKPGGRYNVKIALQTREREGYPKTMEENIVNVGTWIHAEEKSA